MGPCFIAAAIPAAAILLVGCSGASKQSTSASRLTNVTQEPGETTTTRSPVTTTRPRSDEPPPSMTTTTATEPPPKQTTTEPRPAPNPLLPGRGRVAAASAAGPLRFERVYVFSDSSGRFAGRANVINRGLRYLNGIVIRWRVLDAHRKMLARGTARWPSLAPTETATVPFRSSVRYSQRWSTVQFKYVRG
jgi:hypothetical protein